MKTLIIALLGILAALFHVFAQEPLSPIAERTKRSLIEDITEATDVAIVERLDSGRYKVLRVYRGGAYILGTTVNLGELIRSDMRKEERMIVWEKNYIGDFNGLLMIALSIESLPVSGSDEVIIHRNTKVPLKALLPENP